GLRHGLDGATIDADVRQNRSARDIEIPDAVVHELVMPFSLAGFQIDRDQAFPEQPVPGTMSAIIIARRELYRKISQTELRIDRSLGMVWKIQRRLPVRASNPRT